MTHISLRLVQGVTLTRDWTSGDGGDMVPIPDRPQRVYEENKRFEVVLKKSLFMFHGGRGCYKKDRSLSEVFPPEASFSFFLLVFRVAEEIIGSRYQPRDLFGGSPLANTKQSHSIESSLKTCEASFFYPSDNTCGECELLDTFTFYCPTLILSTRHLSEVIFNKPALRLFNTEPKLCYAHAKIRKFGLPHPVEYFITVLYPREPMRTLRDAPMRNRALAKFVPWRFVHEFQGFFVCDMPSGFGNSDKRLAPSDMSSWVPSLPLPI
uniref:Uncharacterized protein n=1 Tax=Timema poppense TaxID=170557 RepID=A0A7R9H8N6_TIMPO|nr:unnamed protein product [Timema poppensis]